MLSTRPCISTSTFSKHKEGIKFDKISIPCSFQNSSVGEKVSERLLVENAAYSKRIFNSCVGLPAYKPSFNLLRKILVFH